MRSKSYSAMIKSIFETSNSQIRSILTHPGEKGRVVEHLLADILQKFTPERFGIGTGFIIDKDDWMSSQIDMVVYDRFCGVPFRLTQFVGLFPIEIVSAVIEIKSNFVRSEAATWLDSYRRIRLRKGNKKFLPISSLHQETPHKLLAPRGYLICASSRQKNTSIRSGLTKEIKKIDTHLHGALIISNDLFIRQVARESTSEDFTWSIYEKDSIEAFLVSYSHDLLTIPTHHVDLSAYFPLPKSSSVSLPPNPVKNTPATN
jgi:hypothetical protein